MRSQTRSGQALVIFAVGSVVMLLFTSLVVDGGITFVRRRQAQGVADLIARAGATVKANGGTDAQVLAAVNGARNANVSADDLSAGRVAVKSYYVDSTGNPCSTSACAAGTTPCDVGSCSSVPSAAVGIASTATTVFPTFLGAMISQQTSTTSAFASIATGGLGNFTGGSPLMVCINAPLVAKPAGSTKTLGTNDIMLGTGTSADPYRIDPSFDAHTFEIWGNAANDGTNCNPESGNSFKGVTDTSFSGCSDLTACVVPVRNGNSTGPTRVRLATATGIVSGCDVSDLKNSTGGCIIIAPIGEAPETGTMDCGGTSISASAGKMCARAWAAFELTTSGCSGNCKMRGILRVNVTVLNGSTGAGAPAATFAGPKVIVPLA